MTEDAIKAAKRIVSALARASELTKANAEKALEVTLVHSPDVGPEFHYFEADLPAGPFSHVEVREPNAEQERSWLAVLTVRDGVQLPLAAFQNDPIPAGPPQDINPHVPPEGADTYIIKTPTQSIHYEFRAQSHVLQLVALHRPPS